MKILIIGSGAREHAIIETIKKSKPSHTIFAAPGNAGTEQIAQNVNISVENIDALVNFAKKEKIDLSVVGPENPLCAGIVDEFESNGLAIFGPNKQCAHLEASKFFAKEFMQKYNIPTARYQQFRSFEAAKEALEQWTFPLVIKADGLCFGKGVSICKNYDEALDALEKIFVQKIFGAEGETVIFEEFLSGVEASVLCLVSKDAIIPLESAKDYKKIFNGDTGDNTGGVGCFSPASALNTRTKKRIDEILVKIKAGLAQEKLDYRGILFIGLMILPGDSVFVLEFNVRFGDPETQTILKRLKSDLTDVFLKTLSNNITPGDLVYSDEYAVTVVLCAKGYPHAYKKGEKITIDERFPDDVSIFHYATKREQNDILTNSGRVLAVTALGKTREAARIRAYEACTYIHFDSIYYRTDIGI